MHSCDRFIASQGCIEPLCNFLLHLNQGITLPILNALEEILKVGEREAKYTGDSNEYVQEVEECGGKAL